MLEQIKNSLKLIFGYCEHCRKWFKYPLKIYIGTMYLNEEDNYMTVCKSCHKKIEDFVSSQWDEYNNERGCGYVTTTKTIKHNN